MTTRAPVVALFVTCIVDVMRPGIGFAAIKLLEHAGCKVKVPVSQTCCGQPAFNSGDSANSIAIAKQVIDRFNNYEYVVAPSGSCAAMIKIHYPELFENDNIWLKKANELAAKTHELISFLVDVRHFDLSKFQCRETITYQDSCSGYSELNIYDQPRKLLSSIDKLTLSEMKDSTQCCGFGGTFCIKYAEISNSMVSDKCKNIESTQARLLTGGDYSCLMNIAGKLNRNASNVKTQHLAEFLIDVLDSKKV